MSLRPEIFIAAAAPEMNACRKAAKQAILEIGGRPVEQGDFRLEYGPLQGVLTQMLQRCAAVIHLSGSQFGMEPAERTLHAPRRSFTHYELDVAQNAGVPIYTFAATPECPLGAFPPEDEEARRLQYERRTTYMRSGGFFEKFSTPEELARQIRALRSKLIVRKSLARLPSRPMAERFIGRTRLIEELRHHLEPGSIHLLQPTQGLAPLGGAGTSALAIELAWRLHDVGAMDFVFWLPAGPGADFEAALAALARTDSLALLGDEIVSQRARLRAVLEWLQSPERRGRFLVIVDGLDDETAWWSLKSYLPSFAHGSVVLTGRPHAMPSRILLHAVAPFSSEQTHQFFAVRLPPKTYSAPAEREALEAIGHLVGRVPLALEMAAGHLRESQVSARAFFASLQHEAQGGEVDLPRLFAATATGVDQNARSLLRMLVCLAPEPASIPLALFEGRGDWPVTNAALGSLERRGLVMRDESSRTIRVHRAIRQIARDQLLPGHVDEALAAARAALDAAFQRVAEASDAASAELRELLIPHCRALLGQLNGHPLEDQTTTLARSLADWLNDCGRAAEAEVFYRRALISQERRQGPKHPELAPRLRDLAGLLRARRKFEEAEQLYQRALSLAQASNDVPEMLKGMQNLAACLRAANRLDQAERVSRRALALEEQHSGDNHPRVAIALHRLAGVVEARNRRREAELLYRRALAIDEGAFGLSHPRIAVRLYHVARSLAASSRQGEAEEYFRRGLDLEEKKLGAEHADLAPVLGELAVVLENLGRAAEAEKLYRRTYRINERLFGATHVETALSAAALGGCLLGQERAAEAVPLLEGAAEALMLEKRRLRRDHPHLKSVRSQLIAALKGAGESEEAVAERVARFQSTVPRREATRWMYEDFGVGA